MMLLADSILQILPHVNASLNGLAFILLLLGYTFIRQGKESLHKKTMLSCFAVSVVFNICYLTYHYGYGHTTFDREAYPTAAIFYYVMLASHIILAVTVPFLAMITIFLGLTNRRQLHKKFARWTFPIWLYVSLTGVLIYFMIYWWFPPTT